MLAVNEKGTREKKEKGIEIRQIVIVSNQREAKKSVNKREGKLARLEK